MSKVAGKYKYSILKGMGMYVGCPIYIEDPTEETTAIRIEQHPNGSVIAIMEGDSRKSDCLINIPFDEFGGYVATVSDLPVMGNLIDGDHVVRVSSGVGHYVIALEEKDYI